MTRYLLTGGGGFVGQWMARTLLARGDDVTLAGIGSLGDAPGVLSGDERAAVRWHSVDFRVQPEVSALIERTMPEVVIHLAGVAFPPDADRDPAGSYDINALGVVRLLAAIAGFGTREWSPSVVVVGSALQYGAHDGAEFPLTERAEQRPLTLYAASKAAQEVAALQMFRATGLRVVCTRSFNHTGPGHGDEYLLPSLVRRALKMKRDGGCLVLGADTVRDYLHVSDVVSAYLLLAERAVSGESYNVASGQGISVTALAREILLRAGVTADISTDPSLVRATDIPVLIGSPAKLIEHTGWAATKTHTDIIDDLLNAATE